MLRAENDAVVDETPAGLNSEEIETPFEEIEKTDENIIENEGAANDEQE